MDDPTKDTIPRSAVEYCLRKETVNTNPDAYEAHERFIAYMDDHDISQFGHWMHSNGFNCALTAIAIDLDKIPSVPTIEPKRGTGYRDGYKRGKRSGYKKGRERGRKTGRWIYHPDRENDGECGYECSNCGRCYDYPMNFCGFCGAKMEVEHEQ